MLPTTNEFLIAEINYRQDKVAHDYATATNRQRNWNTRKQARAQRARHRHSHFWTGSAALSR